MAAQRRSTFCVGPQGALHITLHRAAVAVAHALLRRVRALIEGQAIHTEQHRPHPRAELSNARPRLSGRGLTCLGQHSRMQVMERQ